MSFALSLLLRALIRLEQPTGSVNISVQRCERTAIVTLSYDSGGDGGVATSLELVVSPPHSSCSEPSNGKCNMTVKAGRVHLTGLEPGRQYTLDVTPVSCAGRGNRNQSVIPAEANGMKHCLRAPCSYTHYRNGMILPYTQAKRPRV